MFDLDRVQSEGERFAKELSTLLGTDLTPEALIKLYVASLGKTRFHLYQTTLFYGEEADRCRKADAYFSACLMTASAIESLLAVLCLTRQKDIETSPAYKKFRGKGGYEERVLSSDFQNYIEVASHLGWIPSNVVSSDLLEMAILDFPLMAANLYPDLSKKAIEERLEAFKQDPGIEMLKLLQYMRNLVHGPRWVRLNIKIDTACMEADSKFVFVIANQVMFCLLETFIKLATTGMESLSVIKNQLPKETWNLIQEQVQKLAR